MNNIVNQYIRSSRDLDIHNFNGIKNAKNKYQVKSTKKNQKLQSDDSSHKNSNSQLTKNKSISSKISQIEQLKKINHSIYVSKSIYSKNTPIIEYKKISNNNNVIDYQLNILSKIPINDLLLIVPTLVYNLYVFLTNITIDSPIDLNHSNQVSSEFYTNGVILKINVKPHVKYQLKYQLMVTNPCEYINQFKVSKLSKTIYESSTKELVEKIYVNPQSSEFGFNSDQIGQNLKLNKLQLEITISNWVLCSGSSNHYKSFDYILNSPIRKISNINGFNTNNGLIPLKIINTYDDNISGTVTCPIGCYFSSDTNIEMKHQKFAITNVNIGFEFKNQIKLIQFEA